MINILERIRKHVPEFTTVFDGEDNYPIVFEFGKYLLSHIDDSNLCSRAASFANEIIELELSEEEDLIVIELFQQLYEVDHQVGFLFTSKLSGKAKVVYDSAYKEYRKWFPPKKRKK